MAFRASHRYARINPRKVRPMADLVRGKFADEALDMLRYQPQRGARMLEKGAPKRVGECSRSRPESRVARWSGASGGHGGASGWWADVQADSSASAGNGLHDSQAFLAHSHRPGRY
jgi:ribosomal protein L22